MASATNDWLTAGLVSIDLPSGHRVRGRLPTIAELLRMGLIPGELQAAAMRFADPDWIKEAGPAGTADWFRLTRSLVARFVAEIWNAETAAWDRVQVTLEALGTPDESGTVDPEDVDQLEDLVLRLRSPEHVSALGRVMHAQRTGDEPDAGDVALVEREAAATVEALEVFRRVSNRATRRKNRSSLGDSAIGTARAREAAPGRPGARRGPRNARPDRAST